MALALPLVIPSADLDLLGAGRGGSGGSEIELENPMVDLTRDLVRGTDFPLLRVRTTDRDPSYLRIAVLNRFSADEWSSGDREVPVDQLPRGELPDLEGVSPDVERVEHDYEVEVTEEFESTWLPTQAPVSAVVAPGDWRYDVATMDFIAGEDDLTTAGLRYEMTAVDLARVPEDMVAAPSGAGLVDGEFLELPLGLSPVVDQLATSVTAGAGSPYEKAVALQDWFRSDGNFTYSTDVEPGNGSDDLQKFLVEDRRGYCEQFAAAMAVMARSLGIPARVAVGFLRPDRVGGADLGVQHLGPARLARDLRAGLGMGGLRAHSPGPCRRGAGLHAHRRRSGRGAGTAERERPAQPGGPAPRARDRAGAGAGRGGDAAGRGGRGTRSRGAPWRAGSWRSSFWSGRCCCPAAYDVDGASAGCAAAPSGLDRAARHRRWTSASGGRTDAHRVRLRLLLLEHLRSPGSGRAPAGRPTALRSPRRPPRHWIVWCRPWSAAATRARAARYRRCVPTPRPAWPRSRAAPPAAPVGAPPGGRAPPSAAVRRPRGA